MIDRETIDRIYAAANIVDIIGEYVTLKRKGVNYQACCPFHNEKTPSFVVSPSKGVYKCFGCGKGGNAVTFLMEHENMTYPEALKAVAKRYGIEVREKEMTPEELPRIPLVLRESGSGTLEVIAAALAARGIRLSQFDVTMRLGSTEGIKAFVRNSDAMAIVSVISVVDELRSGALRIVDIEGLTLSRDFVFVHAEAEPARLARRFIDFARADF